MKKHTASSNPVSSDQINEKPKKRFQALGSLFDAYQLEDKGGYITQEFQDFGYRLALELDDEAHKSLYMRLSKQVKRGLLEKALSFVSDAPNVKSKARLFMWKLKQLQTQLQPESDSPQSSKSGPTSSVKSDKKA